MGTHWRGDTPRTLPFATAAIYTEPTRVEEGGRGGGEGGGGVSGAGLVLVGGDRRAVCLSVSRTGCGRRRGGRLRGAPGGPPRVRSGRHYSRESGDLIQADIAM